MQLILHHWFKCDHEPLPWQVLGLLDGITGEVFVVVLVVVGALVVVGISLKSVVVPITSKVSDLSVIPPKSSVTKMVLVSVVPAKMSGTNKVSGILLSSKSKVLVVLKLVPVVSIPKIFILSNVFVVSDVFSPKAPVLPLTRVVPSGPVVSIRLEVPVIVKPLVSSKLVFMVLVVILSSVVVKPEFSSSSQIQWLLGQLGGVKWQLISHQ
mgnify:CR=1 FL=1